MGYTGKRRKAPIGKMCGRMSGKGNFMKRAIKRAAAAIALLLAVMLECSCANTETSAAGNTGIANSVLILCIAGGAVLAAGIIIAAVLLIRKRSAKKTAPSAPDSSIIGEQQPAPAEQPAPVTAKFCKDCGAKIEEGSKFCINCGAKQD